LTSSINETIMGNRANNFGLVLVMPNYYEILGVPRNATDKDIRQAYRKLARQHHPDVNPGDKTSEEKFKQINEAHSVLLDPEKRRKYDKYGDRWQHADQIEEAEARARAQSRRTTFRRETYSGEDPTVTFDTEPGNIFEQIFRNVGADFRQPATAEYPVEVTLEEAYEGATRLVDLAGGRRLEVKIPPGVDNGSRVHIPAGDGRKGGFYLVISVQPHQVFERKGKNLYREIEVPLEEAILGGVATVPTLRGRVALNIPPETQNGQRFRLAGQGMPTLNQPGIKGDLYATIKVNLPTGLSAQEKELFRQLRDLRAARRN
jgi:DnaJ-class molecular chaperone